MDENVFNHIVSDLQRMESTSSKKPSQPSMVDREHLSIVLHKSVHSGQGGIFNYFWLFSNIAFYHLIWIFWMIFDAWTSFESSFIDKMWQKSTFMGKNLTNSVNKINFLGCDRAHIRLIPENNLQQNGPKK